MWMRAKETTANLRDDLKQAELVSSGNVLPWNISPSAFSRIWLVCYLQTLAHSFKKLSELKIFLGFIDAMMCF